MKDAIIMASLSLLLCTMFGVLTFLMLSIYEEEGCAYRAAKLGTDNYEYVMLDGSCTIKTDDKTYKF